MSAHKSKKENLTEQQLHVKIFSPYKVYYDDLAESISAESLTGPFDILRGHHNFLTLLLPCNVVVRRERDELQFKIARGVMHVKENSATLFLDI
jgi:F0F1-type ATP synthase epsilon subunit